MRRVRGMITRLQRSRSVEERALLVTQPRIRQLLKRGVRMRGAPCMGWGPD